MWWALSGEACGHDVQSALLQIPAYTIAGQATRESFIASERSPRVSLVPAHQQHEWDHSHRQRHCQTPPHCVRGCGDELPLRRQGAAVLTPEPVTRCVVTAQAVEKDQARTVASRATGRINYHRAVPRGVAGNATKVPVSGSSTKLA